MFTVLVIEDESIIARDITRTIERIDGVKAVVVDTYKSGIEAIDTFIPDLVLLDIKLYEDEDAGIRIAAYLNELYRIPFIFLSGYATENFLKKAKKERPVTFITKPVDSKQLRVVVLMAINEKQISKFRNIQVHGKKVIVKSEEFITHTLLAQTMIAIERINPDNIVLIKTFNHVKRNTVLIKMSSQEYIVANYTITQILQLLPSNFVKVHSSFIVNKECIEGLIGKTAVKIGDEVITFGSEFKKQKRFRLL